jgi:hypothetical protein
LTGLFSHKEHLERVIQIYFFIDLRSAPLKLTTYETTTLCLKLQQP